MCENCAKQIKAFEKNRNPVYPLIKVCVCTCMFYIRFIASYCVENKGSIWSGSIVL